MSRNASAGFTTASIVYMIVLSVLLGSRIRSLRSRPKTSPLSFIQLLVLLLNTFALSMVITQTILVFELPMHTLAACRAAIYVCLPFYVLAKVCMQLFLVERLHIIRWKHARRLDDWVWCLSVAVIALGFGAIAVVAMMFPIAKLAQNDKGRCHIGLPYKVTIPLLTYDILINFALTGVFVALLWPLLRLKSATGPARAARYPLIAVPQTSNREPLVRRTLRSLSSRCSSASTNTTSTTRSAMGTDTSIPVAGPDTELLPMFHYPLHQETAHIPPAVPRLAPGEARDHRLRSLVLRTLAGTIVVLMPTIINLTLLYYLRGEEQGWMCYLLCMSDVALSVIVMHFLTVDRRDDGEDG